MFLFPKFKQSCFSLTPSFHVKYVLRNWDKIQPGTWLSTFWRKGLPRKLTIYQTIRCQKPETIKPKHFLSWRFCIPYLQSIFPVFFFSNRVLHPYEQYTIKHSYPKHAVSFSFRRQVCQLNMAAARSSQTSKPIRRLRKIKHENLKITAQTLFWHACTAEI